MRHHSLQCVQKPNLLLLLKLLLLLDRAPTVAETELIELSGESRGNLSLKLSLLHYDYSPAILKEMRDFVSKLPAVPGSYEHRASRDDRTLRLAALTSRMRAAPVSSWRQPEAITIKA